jgi:energy-coupling factor transporter ATP-binding protein EcfA2
MTQRKRQDKDGVRMFSSIRLRNFKGYKDSGSIPLRPLTVLIGKNNSGKSTILHALLLLKQTIEDPSGNAALVTSGPLVELGGWYDILRGGNAASDKTVGISLKQDLPEKFRIAPRPHAKADIEIPVAEQLDLTFSCPEKTKVIQTERCTLWNGDKKLIEVTGAGKKWSSDMLPQAPGSRFAAHMINFLPRAVFSRAKENEKVEPVTEEMNRLSMSIHFQSLGWTDVFQNVHRIGPLRSRVPWYSGVGTRTFSEYGQSGENLLAALGRGERDPKSGKPLLDSVNQWVKNKLKILEKVEVKDIDPDGLVRSLVGHEMDGLCGVNVAAMGEGISQILPIIAVALLQRSRECLLVEQPEVHLHPALQADLADLFIEMAMKEGRQVIVETHSEHILLRIRRRVAEATRNQGKGLLKPDQVSILFVEKKGPESTVRRLEMNGKGHFEEWPDGFFDEAYQEAMALAMASAKG